MAPVYTKCFNMYEVLLFTKHSKISRHFTVHKLLHCLPGAPLFTKSFRILQVFCFNNKDSQFAELLFIVLYSTLLFTKTILIYEVLHSTECFSIK